MKNLQNAKDALEKLQEKSKFEHHLEEAEFDLWVNEAIEEKSRITVLDQDKKRGIDLN